MDYIYRLENGKTVALPLNAALEPARNVIEACNAIGNLAALLVDKGVITVNEAAIATENYYNMFEDDELLKQNGLL